MATFFSALCTFSSSDWRSAPFMPMLPPAKPSAAQRTKSRRKTLALVITEHLRQEIFTGLRAPGAKISEPTVAAAHSVSRAPVREALRQLEREGLVVFDAVGRSRVVQLTQHDVEDICSIRSALEAAGAAHACERFDAALEKKLRNNIVGLEDSTTLDEVSQLDVAFHAAIMEASGRRRLVSAWRGIEPQLRLWLATLQRKREAISADVAAATGAAHVELLEVLASGDAAAARLAAATHVSSWFADAGGAL